MIAWLLAAAALAATQPVVALGDGLVAGAPASATEPLDAVSPTVPGGWVAVLADCLEERSPGRFSVVDRSVDGDTAATTRARVPAAREMQPSLALVGVGARELAVAEADRATFTAELDGLLTELRVDAGPMVLLVGMVPPTLSQVAGETTIKQSEIDTRTAAWNGDLAAVALRTEGVVHVDLLADWPLQGAERAKLTLEGWRLSDRGHARVAAMVCDAVVAWDAGN